MTKRARHTPDPAAPEEQETEERGTEERGPLRRCLVSGESRPKEGMIRFVVAPEGQVVPDVDERLPGRGLWLSAERAMVTMAIRRNLFARAARRAVRAPADLVALTEGLLARRCLGLLGLARRAGQAVAGFDKVREWLQAGKGGVLLAALDGAVDGRAKLRGLAGELPRVEVLNAAELGLVFGREHVVHAVVAPGRLASELLREAGRLGGFRQIMPEPDLERNGVR